MSRDNGLLAMLLLVTALVFTWLAATLPLHVDEALTHQHFTSQGWKIAISTYPFPNNHVFFSLLGSFSVLLPLDPLLTMRMISVVSALVSALLIYRLIRLKTTPANAFIGVLFWIATLGGLYYGVHARGYGLQLMFLLFGLYFIEAWNNSEQNTQPFSINSKDGFGLILCSALGFFTVPTFLFPFASLLVLLLLYGWRNGFWKRQLQQLVLIGVGTTILTLILYGPLFYYSGIDSLLSNQWVKERSLANVGLDGVLSFLFDVSAYGGHATLLLVIGITVWSLVSRNWRNTLLVGAFFLIPILGMLVMGSVPFPRTFAYLIAVSIFIVFSNMESILKSTSVTLGYGGVVIGFVVSGWFTYQNFSKSLNKESANSETIQMALQDCCDGHTLYVDGWNETAQLIDYYTWRNGLGPTVKVLYQDDFWKEFQQKEGRFYLKTTEQPEPEMCNQLLEKGNLAVYECN